MTANLTATVAATVAETTLDLSAVRVREEVVAPDGTATSREYTTTTAADPSLTDCSSNRDPGYSGYYPYAPVPLAEQGWASIMHVQYIFFLFRQDGARRLYDGDWYDTQQFEVCSKGGGQSDHGDWKMTQVGAGQADTNTATTKIGWQWKTGPTPPSYTLTYGFALGTSMCAGPDGVATACADSSIASSISQNVSGQLRGGDNSSDFQLYQHWRNNVSGWWDGREIGGVPAGIWQGTVQHGLWEYRQPDPGTSWTRTFEYGIHGGAACRKILGFLTCQGVH